MNLPDKKSIALIAIIALMAGLGFAASQMAIKLARENSDLKLQIASLKERFTDEVHDPDGHWVLPTPRGYILGPVPTKKGIGSPTDLPYEGVAIFYQLGGVGFDTGEEGIQLSAFIFPKPKDKSIGDLFLPYAQRFQNPDCPKCIPKWEDILDHHTLVFYDGERWWFESEDRGYILDISASEDHIVAAKELIKRFYVISK